MQLAEMTMTEFKENLKKTQTVLIPFGSIEEHGGHLPLHTDALIVEEVLKQVVQRQAAFLAPAIFYGVCTSTRDHPGTISIRPETLRRLTRDIVEELYKKGLRNFFLISGHAGGLHEKGSGLFRRGGDELLLLRGLHAGLEELDFNELSFVQQRINLPDDRGGEAVLAYADSGLEQHGA